jgi:hypothetical protein
LNLDPKHQDAAAQVLKYANRFVDRLDNGAMSFNWPHFMFDMVAYTKDDLKCGQSETRRFSQSNADAGTMLDNIADYMANSLRVQVDREALREKINATFTNLKTSSDSDFLHFHSSSSGTNSCWEYRVLFSIDSSFSQNPDRFHALVATIFLSADIFEEEEWWGLSREYRSDFSVEIRSVELLVRDDFNAPPRAVVQE